MSLQIPREQIESIRYHTHHPDLVAAMHRIDPHRFRGLGTARTDTFVRHGWDTAQRLGLRYVNDAAYILFLMTFLGSHFLEDVRYAAIAEALQFPDPNDPPGFDTRIRRTRAAFVAFGDQRIGPKATIYRADLRRFSAWLAQTGTLEVDAMYEALLECHSADVHLTPPETWMLLAEAHASADDLDLEHGEGDALALALRWWLGLRFEDDPLFPWVRDVAAREHTAHARTQTLRAYAQRRMATVLKGAADV